MDKRQFLKTIAAGLSLAAIDPERLLWVPGKKRIFIPPSHDEQAEDDEAEYDVEVFVNGVRLIPGIGYTVDKHGTIHFAKAVMSKPGIFDVIVRR